jgi:hypothetical protein
MCLQLTKDDLKLAIKASEAEAIIKHYHDDLCAHAGVLATFELVCRTVEAKFTIGVLQLQAQTEFVTRDMVSHVIRQCKLCDSDIGKTDDAPTVAQQVHDPFKRGLVSRAAR